MVGGAVEGYSGTIYLYNCLFYGDSTHAEIFGDEGNAAAVIGDTLWAYNTTFKKNSAIGYQHAFMGTYGGAVNVNFGHFLNCTFDDNSTDGAGSAIFAFGADIFNCTFVNNHIDSISGYPGEGGVITCYTDTPHFNIANNIFWNNNKGAQRQTMNFYGPVTSGGCNILPVAAGDTGFALLASDIVGVDPLLDTLGYYGGCVLTYGIKCGSIAIDEARCQGFTTSDAEGEPQQGYRDAGAFEEGIMLGPDIIDTILPGQTINLTDAYYTKNAIVNYYGHFTDSTRVDTGTYIITAISARGCSDTAKVTVLYLPAIDSTDTTIINWLNNINTNNDFIVYPNPAKDYVMIIVNRAGEEGFLEITDERGRLISYRQIDSAQIKMETSPLSQGVYFIAFHTMQGSTVRKLVVQ